MIFWICKPVEQGNEQKRRKKKAEICAQVLLWAAAMVCKNGLHGFWKKLEFLKIPIFFKIGIFKNIFEKIQNFFEK